MNDIDWSEYHRLSCKIQDGQECDCKTKRELTLEDFIYSPLQNKKENKDETT